jgi:hypothetical protein
MPNEFIVKNGLISQGNITVSGSITATGGVIVSGSIASASYASNADTLDGLDSTVFTLTSSFIAQTASFTAFTSSINSFSASVNTFSASILSYTSSLNNKTSSFATTGSNTFIGTETISGSLAISGSGTPFTLNTDTLEITGSLLVTGSSVVTGSLTVITGSLIEFQVTNTGVKIGNALTDTHTVTGSLSVSGSQTFIGTKTITGSVFITGSKTLIGTNTVTGSMLISGSLTATGTITAQTLVVQTITSSVVYSSGSNIFGNDVANSQTFTGSVLITGSLALAGNITSNGTAVILGSGTTNYLPKFTGTSTIGNSSNFDNGTNVGIGTATPTDPQGFGGALDIQNASAGGVIYLRKSSATTTYGWFGYDQSSLAATIAAYGANNKLLFNAGTGAIKMTLDASGNLGLGVTPSAWSGITALQIGGYASFGGDSAFVTYVSSNAYYNAGWKYIGVSAAANYYQDGGAHYFRSTSTTGTAGGAITWITPLTIASTGAATFSSSVTAKSASFIAANNVTGTLLVQGGKEDVTGVGEINSRIDFGSNDGSVAETDGIKSGGRISSVTEFSNGAYVGMAFSTYRQGRSPDLKEALRITNEGNVGIGTSSPQMPLSVQANTGNGAIRLIGTSNASSNNAGIYWYDSNDSTFNGYLGNFSTSFDIYNQRSTPMAFYTGATERMRINSSGHITKPYQPAFKAGMVSSTSFGASATIIFPDTSGNHFNIGGHYSTSTGIFTAPVAGIYVFSTCVIYESMSAGQAMDDAFYIYKNATLVTYSFRRAEYEAGYTGNGGYYVDHANTLLNLAVDDTVKVVNNRSLTVHGNTNYCFFYGYMLG